MASGELEWCLIIRNDNVFQVKMMESERRMEAVKFLAIRLEFKNCLSKLNFSNAILRIKNPRAIFLFI